MLPKTQKSVMTLCQCYNLCGATPSAATVAVTTGEISLQMGKNNLLFPYSSLRHGGSDTPTVITATVAAQVFLGGSICKYQTLNIANIAVLRKEKDVHFSENDT